MYGTPSYRRRYGARYDYYADSGYAGVGQIAGPVVNGGYGSMIVAQSARHAQTYLGPSYGIFGLGKDEKRDRTPNKFWNTVFDVGIVTIAFLNPGAIITVPLALAAVGVRKATVGKRMKAEADVDKARGRKKGWKNVATQRPVAAATPIYASRPPMFGQGNVGTAAQPTYAQQSPVYDVTGGTPPDVDGESNTGMLAAAGLGTLLLLGGAVFLMTRNKRS